MADYVTPKDLAKELGKSERTIRHWLRDQGWQSVPYARWKLSQDQAAQSDATSADSPARPDAPCESLRVPLVECEECHGPISTRARACPHCGDPRRRRSGPTWRFWLCWVLGTVVLTLLVGPQYWAVMLLLSAGGALIVRSRRR